MKKLYLIILLLLIGVAAHAQPYETNPDFKRANIWHFGVGAGIDFNSGTPVSITGGQTGHTWEGFSTLCDTAGNLLFYTDGQTVWNKNHNVVENGTGLMAHTSSTQGSLLLQHPENDTVVYLFTTPSAVNLNTGLRYNIINKHEGNGKVVVKNKLLLTPTTEKLTAINHANGRDIWVIAHGYTTNSYFSYLLTKNGLVECPVESVTGNILEEMPILWQYNTPGNLVSNFQGNQIAASIFLSGKVEVFNFNNSNGRLEIIDTIKLNSSVYCVAYNNNGKRLFIQSINSNIDSSFIYYYENKILTLVSKHKRGQIQYLINQSDKIYVSNMDSSYLSMLDNLDDTLPDFNKKEIELNPSISAAGLPNFNQSYFYNPSINFTVKLNCVVNTVQFYGQDTFSANNHSWLITKQGAIPVTAVSKAPLIEFADTGTYEIRYIASNGSRSDTIIKTIEILPKINKDFLGNDTGWCNAIGAAITLQSPSGMHCYDWSTGEVGTSIAADTTGTYWVKITTPNFCVIYDTVTIAIDTLSNIEADFLGENVSWCESLDSSVMLAAPANMQQYLWSTGETIQQIEVDTAGVYWVQVSVRNQCETGGNLVITDTVVISFDTVPNVPTINRDNDTLKTNALADYYQWFKDEQEIGSNEPQLIITDTGVYKLKITNFFGCTAYSDTIQITEKDTLIDNVNTVTFEGTKIYPNPFNNSLVIERVNIEEIVLSIYNIEGKIILNKRLENNLDLIITDKWVAGIYLIKLTSTNGQIRTFKFIKI